MDLQRPYVARRPANRSVRDRHRSERHVHVAGGVGCHRPGDRILTARAEYASNAIAYLQAAERTGAVVEFVPCDERGQLDALELERTIADETKGPVRLVSVTHVPTSGGLVNPASAIGAVTSRHGIPYLLDACQSVGQMPVDVEEIGRDLLGTGRKYLRRPCWSGFVRPGGVCRTHERAAGDAGPTAPGGTRWARTSRAGSRFEQYEVSFTQG